MTLKTTTIGTLAALGLVTLTHGAMAGSDLEKALDAGAIRLMAEDIADLLVGKTVKARAGDKKFLFYYAADNVISGRLIGGDWSDQGYYGIADTDQICLSITKDQGRLRCITLLRDKDGVVRKYNAQGEMTFELLEFEEGNML